MKDLNEPSSEVKCEFFAMYSGQEICTTQKAYKKAPPTIATRNQGSSQLSCLILNNLIHFNDDEAGEVGKLMGFTSTSEIMLRKGREYICYCIVNKIVFNNINIQNYLCSKGYAIPWDHKNDEYSINDLIRFGWIIIKEVEIIYQFAPNH
jgi:hypothetical protein